MPCSSRTINEMLPEINTVEKCDFLKPITHSKKYDSLLVFFLSTNKATLPITPQTIIGHMVKESKHHYRLTNFNSILETNIRKEITLSKLF